MIVVSPFKRALETAYHTFKDHPNFKNIAVVVNPDVREHFHAICDIANPIQDTIDEFNPLFNNLDLSLLDLQSHNRDLWFLSKNMDPNRYDPIFDALKVNPGKPY